MTASLLLSGCGGGDVPAVAEKAPDGCGEKTLWVPANDKATAKALFKGIVADFKDKHETEISAEIKITEKNLVCALPEVKKEEEKKEEKTEEADAEKPAEDPAKVAFRLKKERERKKKEGNKPKEVVGMKCEIRLKFCPAIMPKPAAAPPAQ
jgi:hypothetical protein